MRTMMIAALLLAACGSVAPPAGNNTGSDEMGSGMGSNDGSGSGSSGPATCMTAADCASGQACDVMQHMCVAAAFSLDKAGFIDDGTRWWTGTSNPTLHGTIDNPGSDPLTASINNMTVGTATITGTTWSIALPMNAIAETDTRVVLRMGNIEQSQLFALDDQAPTAMLFGSVHDERGDQIDFSTGEAVHTHAGASIDLGSTGCPAVYKYAYLEDQTAPLYGREVAPNPLAWQIKVSDSTPLESMDSAYRVRDASGTVLYDWTSISPDATGVYAVSLFRNLIPQLGTETGQMHLDVRFRDSFGNESTTSACWENHPMAPPVEVQKAQPANLFAWTLAADSPISQLMIITQGAKVYTQHIVQHAAEPVTIHLNATGAAVSYNRVAADHYVVTSSGTPTTTFACNFNSCGPAAPTDPADVTDSGALLNNAMYWDASVIDEATNTVIVTGAANDLSFTLPPRAASAAPHSYRVDVTLGVLGTLAPPKKAALESVYIGEYNVNNLVYTGWDPQTGPSVCTQKFCHVTTSGTVCGCTTADNYTEVRAVKSLSLQFGAYSEQLTTGISSSALVPASYAAAGLAVGAATWNAGTDVLP